MRGPTRRACTATTAVGERHRADCLFCRIVAGRGPGRGRPLRRGHGGLPRPQPPGARARARRAAPPHRRTPRRSSPATPRSLAGVLAAARAGGGGGGDRRGPRLPAGVQRGRGRARTRCPTSTCTCSAGGGSTGPRGEPPGAARRHRAWTRPRTIGSTVSGLLVASGQNATCRRPRSRSSSPGNHLMAGLLGQRDELLRLIEEAFHGVHIVGAGQRDHHRRARTPSGWAGSSTSSSSSSSRARASTPATSAAPSTWCRTT